MSASIQSSGRVPAIRVASSVATLAPAPELNAGPAGWAPASLTCTPGVRRSGMVRGVFDALKGVTEPRAGQPLTEVQVGVLTPFLASAYALPAPVVEHDLRQTRLFLGGPTGTKPNWAVTLGHDIYVGRPADMQRMTSWDGRRWLAHELGHSMQWQRSAGAEDEVSHTRRFLASYGAAIVRDPETGGPGAAPVGAYRWLRGKLDHEPGGPDFSSAMHDAHRMEVEAERHAQEFMAAYPA